MQRLINVYPVVRESVDAGLDQMLCLGTTYLGSQIDQLKAKVFIQVSLLQYFANDGHSYMA
jgi:hypothetical protein